MKRTNLYFLLLSVFLGFCSFDAYSQTNQDTLVTYSCQNCTFAEIVSGWERQLGLIFAYRSDILPKTKANIIFNEQPFEKAANNLLEAYHLMVTQTAPKTYAIISRPDRPVNISGQVIDVSTGFPLSYATVAIIDKPIGVSTDEDGRFSLTIPDQPTDILEISFVGYHPVRISAKKLDRFLALQIRLKPQTMDIPEVIVTDFTLDLVDITRTDNKITFEPQAIPTLPGWGEPDILRSLQMIPGISTSDESASRLNIRGGTPDQNLILWDHIPIYHSGHFFGLYSAFNPFVVEKAELFKGHFGAQYGGRLSGVIDLTAQPNRARESTFGIGMNLINVHAFAETPIQKIKSNILISGRRSYTDLIQSSTYNKLFSGIFQQGRLYDNRNNQEETTLRIDPIFFYQDLNAKWLMNPSDKDRLTASLYIADDQLNYTYAELGGFSTSDDIKIYNTGYSLNYQRSWNENWMTKATWSLSKYKYSFQHKFTFDGDLNEPFGLFQQDNNLTDQTFQLTQEWRPSDQHRLTGGINRINQKITYRFLEEFEDETEEFGRQDQSGITSVAFLTYDGQINQNWRIHAGLRFEGITTITDEEQTLSSHTSIQPRLSLRSAPTASDLSAHITFGTYRQYVYQVPALFDDLGTGAQLWLMTDDFFEPLAATEWSIGGQWVFADGMIDATIFNRRTENLKFWRLNIDTSIEELFGEAGQVDAQGLEVLFKKNWRSYRSWLGYTISKVENTYPDINDGNPFPANHDQRHRLDWTHMFVWKKWDFSLSWHYASGLPYTEPTGYMKEMDDDAEEAEYYLNYEEANNLRLIPYHRLDIAINRTVTAKNMVGKIGFSVFNIYDRKNINDIDAYIFPPDVEEGEVLPTIEQFERKMLPFTPNLMIQFNW